MAKSEGVTVRDYKACFQLLENEMLVPMKSMQKKYGGTGVLQYDELA